MNELPPDTASLVDDIIRARRTTKLMLAPGAPVEESSGWNDTHRQALDTMIEGAAWAPFHRRADETLHRSGALDSPLPWRFHVVESHACAALIRWLEQQAIANPESRWSRAWRSKIKDMLYACDVLIQATWLPDAPETEVVDNIESIESPPPPPVMTLGNIEHVAAASAAIQNVLLAAEARGWKSYWSSGGILRDPDVFKALGIGEHEALLGSLFLSAEVRAGSTTKEGGLRNERGAIDTWVRRIEASDVGRDA